MTILRHIFGKILVRRECWALTFLGKLLFFGLVMVAAMATFRGLYSFLSVTCRTRGDVLVVEGWIRSGTIAQAGREYADSHYRTVLVVKDVDDVGNKWDSGRYLAEHIADSLIELGVPKDRVSIVSCNVVRKDRTFHSALAVKQWLQQQGISAKSLDVVTQGPHARRSRYLFKKAFGSTVDVGVIALDEFSYDPVHWWRSSEGVREVLFEGVAYLYARCLFYPE